MRSLLLYTVLLLCCNAAMGQQSTQVLTGPTTKAVVKGGLQVDSLQSIPQDTIMRSNWPKTLPALAVKNGKFYLWSVAAQKWMESGADSAVYATKYWVTSQGYLTSTSAATLYAPISGSANYIQNQNSANQIANFRLQGVGRIGSAAGGNVLQLWDNNTSAALGANILFSSSFSGAMSTNMGVIESKPAFNGGVMNLATYRDGGRLDIIRLGEQTNGQDLTLPRHGIKFLVDGVGKWMDMPTSGSFIGSGGAGNDVWLGKPLTNGQFYTNSTTASLIQRNATGTIIIGNNASTGAVVISGDILTLQKQLRLANLSIGPAASNGDTYYNSTSHLFQGYRNGGWTSFLMSGDAAGSVLNISNASNNIAMNIGSNRVYFVTNAAAGSYNFLAGNGDQLIAADASAGIVIGTQSHSGIRITQSLIDFSGGNGASLANMRLVPQGLTIGTTSFVGSEKLRVNGSVSIAAALNLPALTAPTDSADASGAVGDLIRDASGNLYLKTATGWLKFTGVTF